MERFRRKEVEGGEKRQDSKNMSAEKTINGSRGKQKKGREQEKERRQGEQAGLLSRGQRDNVTVCELYTKQAFCDELAKSGC